MHIRPFTPQNHHEETAVIDLWVRCGLVVPWNNPHQDIARKLAQAPELFLVGIDESNETKPIIASVMGGYEGHRGWINYLAVAPAWQGQGLGRQMMAAIEAKLSALGCPKINLQVRATNTAVLAFYEALGYQNDHVTSLGKRLYSDEPHRYGDKN